MLRDERFHLREINLLVHTDGLGWQIRHPHRCAAEAPAGTGLNHLIGRVADDPAVALRPALGAAGFERSRCSLRSVEGGFDEVREVFSGRCNRSTSSISSSLLRRSRSLRPMPLRNQQNLTPARAWVITLYPLPKPVRAVEI